jgi:hypothetical protein
LKRCRTIEKKYDEGTRIAQTRQALEKNERIAKHEAVVAGYYKDLADKGMFVPIYGAVIIPGRFPFICRHILSDPLGHIPRSICLDQEASQN